MYKTTNTGKVNFNYADAGKISPDAQKLYELLPEKCWMTENNLGKAIKVRGAKIKSLKEELEAARLIDIYFYPNGKRGNAKHEIIKRNTPYGSPICKHIKRAYCINEWGWLDRNSLIECYIKSNWNIIPFAPNKKRPVKFFCVNEWKRKSSEEKMDYFYYRPTLNVGLVNCHFTIVDIETKNNIWLDHENFGNTLTVSTARGYQCYFRNDPVITTSTKALPDIDTRCKGSFVVLPPSVHPTGVPYQWATIWHPQLLPIEFRREWRQRYFESCEKSSGFLLPQNIPEGLRNDTLWRYGRSLRKSGKTFYEIEDELGRVNHSFCDPPLPPYETQRLIKHVWNHPDRTSFQISRK